MFYKFGLGGESLIKQFALICFKFLFVGKTWSFWKCGKTRSIGMCQCYFSIIYVTFQYLVTYFLFCFLFYFHIFSFQFKFRLSFSNFSSFFKRFFSFKFSSIYNNNTGMCISPLSVSSHVSSQSKDIYLPLSSKMRSMFYYVLSNLTLISFTGPNGNSWSPRISWWSRHEGKSD